MIERAHGTVRTLPGEWPELVGLTVLAWLLATILQIWLPPGLSWALATVGPSSFWFLARGRYGIWPTAFAFALTAGLLQGIPWLTWGWVGPLTALVTAMLAGHMCPVALTVEVTGVVDASPERTFAALTEHPWIARHPGVRQLRLVQPGFDCEHGPGAIREVELDRGTFREHIVSWDPPHEVVYKVVKASVPIEHIEGLILLEPEGKGTRVRWRSGFIARVRWTAGAVGRWAASGMARDLARHLDTVGAMLQRGKP